MLGGLLTGCCVATLSLLADEGAVEDAACHAMAFFYGAERCDPPDRPSGAGLPDRAEIQPPAFPPAPSSVSPEHELPTAPQTLERDFAAVRPDPHAPPDEGKVISVVAAGSIGGAASGGFIASLSPPSLATAARVGWNTVKWGRLALTLTPIGLGVGLATLAAEAVFFGYGQDDAGQFIDDAWTDEAMSPATPLPPNIDGTFTTPWPERDVTDGRETLTHEGSAPISEVFEHPDLEAHGIHPHELHVDVAELVDEDSPHRELLGKLGELALPAPSSPDELGADRDKANQLERELETYIGPAIEQVLDIRHTRALARGLATPTVGPEAPPGWRDDRLTAAALLRKHGLEVEVTETELRIVGATNDRLQALVDFAREHELPPITFDPIRTDGDDLDATLIEGPDGETRAIGLSIEALTAATRGNVAAIAREIARLIGQQSLRTNDLTHRFLTTYHYQGEMARNRIRLRGQVTHAQGDDALLTQLDASLALAHALETMGRDATLEEVVSDPLRRRTAVQDLWRSRERAERARLLAEGQQSSNTAAFIVLSDLGAESMLGGTEHAEAVQYPLDDAYVLYAKDEQSTMVTVAMKAGDMGRWTETVHIPLETFPISDHGILHDDLDHDFALGYLDNQRPYVTAIRTKARGVHQTSDEVLQLLTRYEGAQTALRAIDAGDFIRSEDEVLEGTATYQSGPHSIVYQRGENGSPTTAEISVQVGRLTRQPLSSIRNAEPADTTYGNVDLPEMMWNPPHSPSRQLRRHGYLQRRLKQEMRALERRWRQLRPVNANR